MTQTFTRVVCAMLSTMGAAALVAFADPANAFADAPAAAPAVHAAAPAIAAAAVRSPRG